MFLGIFYFHKNMMWCVLIGIVLLRHQRVPTLYIIMYVLMENLRKWAATWQNQQSECAPSEDSDQPGHPPSLIRVFAVRMKKARVLSYPLSAQWRLWSDWADAQADLSLRWAHSHFVGFVMSRLISYNYNQIPTLSQSLIWHYFC